MSIASAADESTFAVNTESTAPVGRREWTVPVNCGPAVGENRQAPPLPSRWAAIATMRKNPMADRTGVCARCHVPLPEK